MSAPSGYTALDFVGFTDKGTYSPIVKYMRNDLVHYGGNIMRCKVDDTMNVTPVEGANWELWVGTSANLVERVIAPLENNPADVAFGVGRQIIYDDWLWEVIAPIAVGDALIDYDVDPTNANIKKSAPVETQLLAVKAEADATDNMIAPTEANANSSSAAYSVGDQLILNNILYDVIAAIQVGDAITTGTGGNIKAADTLTEQLAAKANSSDLAAVATSGAYSDLSGTPTLATVATSGSYNDLSNKPTLGTAAAKDSTNAVTSGSTDLVESGAVYTEIQTLANQVSDSGDAYSPSKAYKVGELVIHDNTLYRCTRACSAGSWTTNQSCFTAVTLTDCFNNFLNGDAPVNSLEIVAPIPVIDFHYGNSILDYTNRIQEFGKGELNVTGNLTIGKLTEIASNCDTFFNATGFFIATPDAINSPYNFAAIILQVRMTNNYKAQLAIPMAGGETTLKIRHCDSGRWGAWRTISTT